MLSPQPAAAAPHQGASPFCVMPGSSDGPGGAPQVCRYFSYEECLQAAANLRGNCVANIDYQGGYERTPTGWRARQ